MKKETVQGIVEEWQEAAIEAFVCYSAPSHRTKTGGRRGYPSLSSPQQNLS
jgi:hypothetical protein